MSGCCSVNDASRGTRMLRAKVGGTATISRWRASERGGGSAAEAGERRPRGGRVLDCVRRQRQRLRPRDQRLSQPHLELAQPVADRARGDAQLVGGGHDAAEARDGFERLQAVQWREALHA